MEEMRDAFGKQLVELGKMNRNIYVADADLNTSTRTIHFAKEFPRRFIQVGIAEQNMIGISAGLSIEGKIPIACTFAAFLSTRALDQVSNSVAYPKLNVKLAGAYCGLFASKCGATHQSMQDLANMRSMPNMRVIDPADNEELKRVIFAAVKYNGPVYFRITQIAPDATITNGLDFEWGKGYKLMDGTDVTLISTGIASQWAIKAAEELRKENIKAMVLHIPCLKPLDEEIIVKAAKGTGVVVTIENHSVIGGLGSAVCETLCKELPTPVFRCGIQDRYGDTGSNEDLIIEFQLGIKDIIEMVKYAINFKKA